MTTYENYAKLRKSKGMRDGDVAKKAAIPPSTFSDWKKGKSTPKEEKMRKIADALGVSYLELIGLDDVTLGYMKDEYVISLSNDDELRRASLVIAYLSRLNEKGFGEALNRIEELSQLKKYQKDENED